jgi:hypothetical protein
MDREGLFVPLVRAIPVATASESDWTVKVKAGGICLDSRTARRWLRRWKRKLKKAIAEVEGASEARTTSAEVE